MDTKAMEGFLRAAAVSPRFRYTRFLDPAEAAELVTAARARGIEVHFWGGFEGAERTIAAAGGSEAPELGEYPLCALCSAYESRYGTITHRDVLGAFMGLGLTRDCIGDIIIRDSLVYLFTVRQMEAMVRESLTSAGRVKLNFRLVTELEQIPEPPGQYFRETVASLRLDAVIAAAFRMSRSEAADVIRAGRVKLNHVPTLQASAQVSEGAMLSLAGTGRVSLRSIDGVTKKQRTGVTFFRYQ